jgi:glyoxylase-like metal-dependent hydrolase (beta-lactamase superfamily II)
MSLVFSRRYVFAPAFLLGRHWSCFPAAWAQTNVQPVSPLLTEEAQLVVFDGGTWQLRELTKRLPLGEAWPQGQAMQRALERFGLTQRPSEQPIPMPALIARDVYLIGQDRLSNLTYMIDCGPQGVAVIDPTYESEFERTVANIEKCGRTRKDIRWVVNTHCHVDHAMADKKFRDAGAEIMVHQVDADAIERGTQVTAYYLVAKTTGLNYFPRCKIDRRLSDGEELTLGNKTLLVIHTPGHTPGSASFLLQVDGKNLLFAGDTVLYDYRLGWQGNPYADNRQYLFSLEKLDGFTYNAARVSWDILLPGHGTFPMDKAYLDVKKARELVAADLAAGREILSTPFATEYYRSRM